MYFVWWLDSLRTDLMLQEAVPVPHEAESEVALDPGLRLPGQGQVQLQQVEVGAVPGMEIINVIITVQCQVPVPV